MNGLNRLFCERRILGGQLDDIVKGVFETDDVEMFAQGFFGNGNAFLQNQGRFAEGQGIAFDGVGIVRRLNDEFIL